MKYYLLLLVLFLNTYALPAQTCDCAQEFDFVVSYLERNLPAFGDNVTEANRAEYEVFKQQLRKQIQEDEQTPCMQLLNQYVEFFKDNHTRIQESRLSVDESDNKAVKAFLKSDFLMNWESVELPEPLHFDPNDPIEGVYTAGGDTYRVAVMKNNTATRDYVGVMLSSSSKIWPKGNVKFELKKTENGLSGYFYYRNYTTVYQPDINYHDGALVGTSWRKESSAVQKKQEVSSAAASFEIIGDSVVYLKVSSFDGQLFSELDSIYKAIAPTIYKYPYLIIDVRGNGGGSDSNVTPLIPFLYAEPIIIAEKVDYYVTADNLKKYEEMYVHMKEHVDEFGQESVDYMEAALVDLRKAPLNAFLPMSDQEADTISMEASVFPRKVGILYDKGCASSCETLLFIAKESSKTLLLGENSGGYVGYGNVFPVETPCGNTLQVTTTRYQQQRHYEVIGISPDVRLKGDDWVTQSIEILKQQKE